MASRFMDRRCMLAGTAAAGLLGLVSSRRGLAQSRTSQESPAGAAKLPTRDDFVIRGAYVITMDRGIGDLKSGDVHVRAGQIVAVGPSLNAPGASVIDGRDMVVLPGFVDTHTHFWTTQMRGRFGDTADTIYFKIRNILANGYTAADMFHGSRLGALEAVHAGITTALDFCHNLRGRDFALEALRGIGETGLRTRFLYGASTTTPAAQAVDLAVLEDLNHNWRSIAGDAPLTLGLGWRGPLGIVTPAPGVPISPALSAAKEEFDTARRLGLPISVHVSGVTAKAQFEALTAGSFLGKDVQLIHMSNATAAQIKTAVDADASISLTPITELRVGYGITQLADYTESGGRVGIGVDSNSLAGTADMFTVMKLFQSIEAGRKKSEIATPARRLLELATIDGARSVGMDGLIGSLTPGKRADLIMVDTRAVNLGMFADDPVHLLVEAARPDNVDTVVVDGRILKRNGELTVLDGKRVVAEARQSINDIAARTRK